MLSDISICLYMGGVHVTITHDVLDLTVQSPWPPPLDRDPLASDIWWPSLEACSNLFTSGPLLVLTSGGYWSKCGQCKRKDHLHRNKILTPISVSTTSVTHGYHGRRGKRLQMEFCRVPLLSLEEAFLNITWTLWIWNFVREIYLWPMFHCLTGITDKFWIKSAP